MCFTFNFMHVFCVFDVYPTSESTPFGWLDDTFNNTQPTSTSANQDMWSSNFSTLSTTTTATSSSTATTDSVAWASASQAFSNAFSSKSGWYGAWNLRAIHAEIIMICMIYWQSQILER